MNSLATSPRPKAWYPESYSHIDPIISIFNLAKKSMPPPPFEQQSPNDTPKPSSKARHHKQFLCISWAKDLHKDMGCRCTLMGHSGSAIDFQLGYRQKCCYMIS